jgi:hypothetical protein
MPPKICLLLLSEDCEEAYHSDYHYDNFVLCSQFKMDDQLRKPALTNQPCSADKVILTRLTVVRDVTHLCAVTLHIAFST